MPVHALPVPAELDRWLAGIRRHETGGATQRVLSDGCHDILFDLERGTARVVGPLRTAAVVRSTVDALRRARFKSRWHESLARRARRAPSSARKR